MMMMMMKTRVRKMRRTMTMLHPGGRPARQRRQQLRLCGCGTPSTCKLNVCSTHFPLKDRHTSLVNSIEGEPGTLASLTAKICSLDTVCGMWLQKPSREPARKKQKGKANASEAPEDSAEGDDWGARRSRRSAAVSYKEVRSRSMLPI